MVITLKTQLKIQLKTQPKNSKKLFRLAMRPQNRRLCVRLVGLAWRAEERGAKQFGLNLFSNLIEFARPACLVLRARLARPGWHLIKERELLLLSGAQSLYVRLLIRIGNLGSFSCKLRCRCLPTDSPSEPGRLQGRRAESKPR